MILTFTSMEQNRVGKKCFLASVPMRARVEEAHSLTAKAHSDFVAFLLSHVGTSGTACFPAKLSQGDGPYL